MLHYTEPKKIQIDSRWELIEDISQYQEQIKTLFINKRIIYYGNDCSNDYKPYKKLLYKNKDKYIFIVSYNYAYDYLNKEFITLIENNVMIETKLSNDNSRFILDGNVYVANKDGYIYNIIKYYDEIELHYIYLEIENGIILSKIERFDYKTIVYKWKDKKIVLYTEYDNPHRRKDYDNLCIIKSINWWPTSNYIQYMQNKNHIYVFNKNGKYIKHLILSEKERIIFYNNIFEVVNNSGKIVAQYYINNGEYVFVYFTKILFIIIILFILIYYYNI